VEAAGCDERACGPTGPSPRRANGGRSVGEIDVSRRPAAIRPQALEIGEGRA
jgi:hypothetical protein